MKYKQISGLTKYPEQNQDKPWPRGYLTFLLLIIFHVHLFWETHARARTEREREREFTWTL